MDQNKQQEKWISAELFIRKIPDILSILIGNLLTAIVLAILGVIKMSILTDKWLWIVIGGALLLIGIEYLILGKNEKIERNIEKSDREERKEFMDTMKNFPDNYINAISKAQQEGKIK